MSQTKRFVVVRVTEVEVTVPDNYDPYNEGPDNMEWGNRAIDASVQADVGDLSGPIETSDGTGAYHEGVSYVIDPGGGTWIAVEPLKADGSVEGRDIAVSDLHCYQGFEPGDFPIVDNRDPDETWVWTDGKTHVEMNRGSAIDVLRSFNDNKD